MLFHLCTVANALCVFAWVFAGHDVGSRMSAVAGGGKRGPHIGLKPAIDTHSFLAKGCINKFHLYCQLLSHRVKCSEFGGEKKQTLEEQSLLNYIWMIEHSMCFIYAVCFVFM